MNRQRMVETELRLSGEGIMRKENRATKKAKTTGRHKMMKWIKQGIGAALLTLMAASVSAAPLSGKVYLDYDNSGHNTNAPLAGLTIELQDLGGSVIDSTTTDAAGSYNFNTSTLGTFKVVAKTVNSETKDINVTLSGAGGQSGQNIFFKGAGGDIRLQIKDELNAGVKNIPVTFSTAAYGSVDIATNASGYVDIKNTLKDVNYTATVLPSDIVADTTNTKKYALWDATLTNGSNDYVNMITFAMAGTNLNGSFNVKERNDWGGDGIVAIDQDENGVYSSAVDTGAMGMLVELYYPGTTTKVLGTDTITTTEDGKYNFKNLAVASYDVKVTNVVSPYIAVGSTTGNFTVSGTTGNPSAPIFLLQIDPNDTTLGSIKGNIFSLISSQAPVRGPDSGATGIVMPQTGGQRFATTVNLYQHDGSNWKFYSTQTSKSATGEYGFKGLPKGFDYKVEITESGINTSSYAFVNDTDGKSTSTSASSKSTHKGKVTLSNGSEDNIAPREIIIPNLTTTKVNQNFWYSEIKAAELSISVYLQSLNGGGSMGSQHNGLSASSMGAHFKVDYFEEDGVTPAKFSNGTNIPTASSLATKDDYGRITRLISYPDVAGIYYLKYFDHDASKLTMTPDAIVAHKTGNSATSIVFVGNPANTISGTIYLNKSHVGSVGSYDSSTDIAMASVRLHFYRQQDVTGAWQLVSTYASASNGTYKFTNLPEGTYKIKILKEFGTIANIDASDVDIEDNITGSGDGELIVTVSGGVDIVNQDLWFKLTNTNLQVKGEVYLDTLYNDGLITAYKGVNQYNDFLLRNATVLLCHDNNINDCTLSGADLIASVVTGNDGSYQFDGTALGLNDTTNYVVKVVENIGLTAINNGSVAGSYTFQFSQNNGIPIKHNFLMKGVGNYIGESVNDMNGNQVRDGAFNSANPEIPININGTNTTQIIKQWDASTNKWEPFGSINGVFTHYNNNFNLYNLPAGKYLHSVSTTNKAFMIADQDPTTIPGLVEFEVLADGNIADGKGNNNRFLFYAAETGNSFAAKGAIYLDVAGTGVIDDSSIIVPGSELGSVSVSGFFTPKLYPDYTLGQATVLAGTPDYLDSNVASNNGLFTLDATNAATGKVQITNFLLRLDNLPSQFEIVKNSSDTKGAYLPTAIQNGLEYMQVTPTTAGAPDQYWLVKLKNATQISGQLYYDYNDDGNYVVSDGDSPISGVRVELYKNGSTTPYTYTTTDTNGRYEFNSLFDGSYTVKVTSVGLDTLAYELKSPSDTVAGLAIDVATTPTIGNVDFIYKKIGDASISGNVMVDINNNGDVDISFDKTGDLALENVVVNLYKNSVSSANFLTYVKTNAKGYYSFSGIDLKTDYVVEVVLPSGYAVIKNADNLTSTTLNLISIGATPSSESNKYFLLAGDSNNNPSLGNAGATNSGIAGYTHLSGTTTPLPNVLVSLTDKTTGKEIARQYTSASGDYHFYNLISGQYDVSVISSPSGYALVENVNGTGQPLDVISNITVPVGGVVGQYFLYKTASPQGIQGKVYVDFADSNTSMTSLDSYAHLITQDVTVELYDGSGATGTKLMTTTTTNGAYKFPNLIYGTGADYSVKIVMSSIADYEFKLSKAGNNPTNDIVIDITNLPAAGSLDNDYLLVGKQKIGGNVWIDADGDFSQGTGELYNGASVTLSYVAPGAVSYSTLKTDVTATDLSSVDGQYLFSKLPKGFDYKVEVTAPAGTSLVPVADIAGNTDTFEFTALATYELSNSSAYKYNGVISGHVSIDVDYSKTKTTVDGDFAGVVVTLTETGSLGLTRTTNTKPDGTFEFKDLPIGSWQLSLTSTQTALNGYSLSYAIDSDGTNTSGSAALPLTMVITQSDSTFSDIEVGYHGNAVIKGYVVIDSNGNDTYDAGDGVFGSLTTAINPTLTLSSGTAGFTDRIITVNAVTGEFEVDSLAAHNYQLTINDSVITAAGYALKFSPLAGTSSPLTTETFAITAPNDTTYSATPANQTFGYVNNRTISGKVYLDMGGNEEHKAFNPLLDGAKVTATNGSLTRTQTVGSNGEFSLSNITEGTWTVSVSHPTRSDLVYSYYTEVAVAAASSSSANSIKYVVDASTASTISLNLGMMGQSSVAGKVVYDRDVSETLNTGDDDIAGLTVYLTHPTDASVIYNTTVTDGTGDFGFTHLATGNYQIKLVDSTGTLLNGYVISFSPSGTASTNTAMSVESISFANDTTALTAKNFGYKGNSGISGYIYQDLLGNGTHYSSNPVLGNVIVSAVKGGTTLTATSATTDGSYEIKGLTPGIWTIQVTNYPSMDWNDSYVRYSDTAMVDAASIITLTIPTAGNTAGYGLDFGAKASARIAGKVVIDMDVTDNAANGYQAGPVDVPLNGIQVTLKVNGNSVNTTTNSLGEYTFSHLAIANYDVIVNASDAQLTGYDISFSPAVAASAGTDPASSADQIQLTALNSSVFNLDYGYKSQGSLVGTIYQDFSGKGVHQSYHDKLAGTIVKAVNVANPAAVLYSTLSDSNGEYVINNIAAGKWTVTIDTPTTDYSYSYLGTTVGHTSTVVTQGVEINMNPTSSTQEQVDFGLKGSAKIEGRVVIDVDDSVPTTAGIDAADIGVDVLYSAYKVALYVGTNNVHEVTVQSDTLGSYKFENLAYGVNYIVKVSKPDTGYVSSFMLEDASYVQPTSIQTADDMIETYKFATANDVATNVSFAWKGAGSIEGRVFLDDNDDGAYVAADDQDVGALVTVTLTHTTNASIPAIVRNIAIGDTQYKATGVLPGKWKIEVANVPTTLRASFDPDDNYGPTQLPATVNEAIVSITASGLTEQHFGYIKGGIIEGKIFEDADGMGLSGVGGHTPLEGVKVYLLDGNLVTPSHVASATDPFTVSTTGNDGQFSFRNLAIDASGGTGITHHIRVLYGDHNDGTVSTSSSDPLYERLPYYEMYTDIISSLPVTNDLIDVLTPPATISYTGIGGAQTIPVKLVDTTNTNSRVGHVLDMVMGYRAADSDVTIIKTALKDNVVVGDIVPYTIRIINNTTLPANIKIKDILPAGFKFVSGSARFDGNKIANPTGGRTAMFGPYSIKANGEAVLSYLLVVGSGVTQGEYTNTAVAVGAITGNAISNTSEATVTVTNDPLFDDALIFGKVYIDTNGNGVQDPGEEGLGGVKLVTVRGEIITTDQYGRYHIVGVSGGRWERGTNFILKLDPRSLPKGYKVVGRNPIVVRLSPGLPSKVDFKVIKPE